MIRKNFSQFLSILLPGAAIVVLGLSSLIGSAQPVFAMPGSEPFDGNFTADSTPNPSIMAHYDNWIGGSEWELGSTVYVEVDDPVNGTGVDFEGSGVVGQDPTIPNLTWVQFNLSPFQIRAGQQITMWDSPLTTTKTMVVSALGVSSIDLDNDVISGVTDSPDPIYVTANCEGTTAIRLVIPVNGAWSADFSEVGTGASPAEQIILDLIQGCSGPVEQSEPDGDSTIWHWRQPVVVANLTENMVYSETWPLGSTATVAVDDASNGPGIDYTDSEFVAPAPWGDPHYTWVEFHPQGFVLEANDRVTLSGNSFTKELLVEPLEMAPVDIVSDTVQGTALASAELLVWASNRSGESGQRVVTADGDGDWIVDFSIPGSGAGQTSTVDIQAGSYISVDVFDADGDYTEVSETLPNPTIFVTLNRNAVWGGRWTPDVPVTLTIDNPSNGVGIDFQQVRIPQPGAGDPNDTQIQFDLGTFQLGPNQLVEMTNGVFSKSLTVQYVKVTDMNVTTDTVTGLADPGVEVFVYLEGPHGFTQRRVMTDTGGAWSVDFSVLDPNDPQSIIVDIAPGISGGAARLEADDDFTEFSYDVTGEVIGPSGGSVVSQDNTASLAIPADALEEEVTLSVTDLGGNYQITTSQDPLDVLSSFSIQPHDLQFNEAVNLTLAWNDANDDGKVDGTAQPEENIFLVKDGEPITPPCGSNPACDMDANRLTVQIFSLSLFELVIPVPQLPGDSIPPLVSSVNRSSPDPTSAATVSFKVTFSEPVTGVDPTDFMLMTTGVTGANITHVSGSGVEYSVTINTGSGNGKIRLDVMDNNSILDGATNSLGGSNVGDGNFTDGQTYLVRKTPTFADVQFSYWGWGFIERLYAAGITGGCGVNPLRYCPEDSVTRAQMAVFLERGIHGVAYNPPAVAGSTGFTDVSIDYWSAAWIKQLAADGITGGCGVGTYCPEAPVTRAQMAVFLLRSKYGAAYTPPAVGSSTGFSDVPSTYWSAAWIKQLVAEGITSGCGAGTYCPEAPVTRAQMAVFLVKTFNLP